MTVYGYIRVSTEEQGRSGLGLASQRTEIMDEYPNAVIVEEVASGASVKKRPLFLALIDRMQKGDTLIVTKPDRFSRSLVDAALTLRHLTEKDVGVVILSLGIDTATAAGKAMLSMMFVFAEFERDLISLRTKDALAAAVARGQVLGRPKGYTQKQAEAVLNYPEASATQLAAAFNMSRDTVNRIRKAAAGGKVQGNGSL
jgi:DNA invertase Pin-like site-specific DNA recombinase